MGRVIAICISEKKGTQKHSVQEAEFIEEWGIKNDAHAGLMTKLKLFVREAQKWQMAPLEKIL